MSLIPDVKVVVVDIMIILEKWRFSQRMTTLSNMVHISRMPLRELQLSNMVTVSFWLVASDMTATVITQVNY